MIGPKSIPSAETKELLAFAVSCAQQGDETAEDVVADLLFEIADRLGDSTK